MTGVEPDAPQHPLADRALDVGRGPGVATGGQGVLGVVEHAHVDAERRTAPWTNAAIGPLPVPSIVDLLAVVGQRHRDAGPAPSTVAVRAHADQREPAPGGPSAAGVPGGRYSSANSGHSAAGDTSPPSESVAGLHDAAELDLQPARQVQVVLGLEDVGHAALAGLAVDPDDGLVGAADVVRVDRQVGHRPDQVVDRLAVGRRRRRSIASKPFLIASWCEPEKAVKTRSPPHGWRSCTGSWLQYSTVRRISSMSEKSICGSMPWLKRFMPRVTRQTLPVRSPLPNRQPSIRSAPAR